MKHLVIIVISSLVFSCKNTNIGPLKTVELTFESVILTSFYGATDIQYQKIIKETDSILKNHPEHQSYNLYKHLKRLDYMKLLRKPSILVYDEKDTKLAVHLDEKSYEKVKSFNYKELHNEGKKVMLQLYITQKDDYVFYSDQIISVMKVKGDSRINGGVMKFMN